MSSKNYGLVILTLASIIVLPIINAIDASAQVMTEYGGLLSQPHGPFAGRIDALASKIGQGLEGRAGQDALREEVRQALKREPTRDELYFYAGQILLAQKNVKGFDYLFAAIKLAPDNWTYRSALGDGYRRLGKKQKAIDSYLAAAKVAERRDGPGAAVTYKWAADLLRQIGRSAEAAGAYEKSLARFSAYAADIEQRMYDERSRRAWTAVKSDAMTQWRAVDAKLAKTRPNAQWITKELSWLGAIPEPVEPANVIHARVTQAVAGLRSGIVTGGGAHLILAGDYAALGRPGDSLVEILAAVELDPKSALAWRALADAYARQGRLRDAANAYSKACDLSDKDSRGYSRHALQAIERFKAGGVR